MSRRNPLASIADALFAHKARRRPVPARRLHIEPMEDRRMLATLEPFQNLDDQSRHLMDDDRLTGEKTFTAGGLTYSSATDPEPIISVEMYIPLGVSVETLESVDVELRVINLVGGVVANKNYPATGLSELDVLRFTLQVDAGALDTGMYEWSMDFVSHYSDRADDTDDCAGTVYLVNRHGEEAGSGPNRSEFGDGWWLNSYERLYAQAVGVGMVDAAGQVVFFPDDGYGGFLVQNHDRRFVESFVQNIDDSYTVTYVNGTVCEFDDTGRLLERIDRNSNVTSYSYNGDLLSTITEPTGRTTSLAYDSNDRLEAITDYAGRSTLFDNSGGTISTITFPVPAVGVAAPEIEQSYDGSLLSQIIDARGIETNISMMIMTAFTR